MAMNTPRFANVAADGCQKIFDINLYTRLLARHCRNSREGMFVKKDAKQKLQHKENLKN